MIPSIRRLTLVAVTASAAWGCYASTRRAPGPRASTPRVEAKPPENGAPPVEIASAVEKPALPADGVRSQADCPPGMVFVPAGHFVYQGRPFDGTDASTVTRTFDVQPFCIDAMEVKGTDFLRSHLESAPAWECTSVANAQTCLTADQAEAYCQKTRATNRLPSPEEFLYAARGSDGRKFPWGNSWYPWGDDVNENRPMETPTSALFCDFEIQQGIRSRETVFGRNCSLYGPMLDVGPFGVMNLGSNVLEWTSGKYRKSSGLMPNGENRCTILGLDFTTRALNGFPPDEDLAPQRYISCDESRPLGERVSDLVGFRCATSKRWAADEKPAPWTQF